MANLSNDTMNRVNGAANDFRDKAQDVASSWASSTKQAGEKIGSAASTVASRASNYLREGQDFVKSNPTQGVAIAAATGIAIGSLLTMMMRSSRR